MINNFQALEAPLFTRFIGAGNKRIAKTVKTIAVVFIAIVASTTVSIAASNDLLTDNYPERYTVTKGDTLWDISASFLRDPWRWREIWRSNPGVENPDVIYPGDVLVMTFVDGKPTLRSLRTETVNNSSRPTVKLSPTAREVSYRDAIPAVDPSAIQAYLNAPLVTDSEEIRDAGYIVDGVDSRLLMGKYDQFYARGIDDQNVEEYRVFRPGRHFIDPVSKESLGYEAEHVGDARMLQTGDPARLALLKTYSDVVAEDRVRPIYKKSSLPFFYPKAPQNKDIRGVILPAKNTVTNLGPLSVVALNLGERDQVSAGDVFRILSQGSLRRDPINGEAYRLPEEKIGLLMVFRTFEKVSYALVTDATRAINLNDIVVSPEAD